MNTDEVIISQKDFNLVHKLMTSRRRNKGTGYDNVLVCVNCGYDIRVH